MIQMWRGLLARCSSQLARPLSPEEQALYQPYFQNNTLAAARITESEVPFWLFKNMSGVVLYHHIYLRAEIDQPRVYQPFTAQGVELLAHELTHVEQYLSGLTLIKYVWASLRGYRNNPYEIEAYAKAAVIRAQYLAQNQ